MPCEATPRSFASPSCGSVRHHRARARDTDGLPGGDVRRATDDLRRRRAADVDHADVQPVGVRVLLALEHVADDEVLGAEHTVVLDPLDLGAGQRQPLRQRLCVHLRPAVLVQPLERDPHANCSRKRMSLS